MASSLRSFAAALLFVMLFMTTELGRNTILVAEARKCETPSSKYKGICGRDGNCASVCRTEGFPHGDCKGIRRSCICSKPC
ncbi:PREDICTED: defensin D2-like isoform X2 [Ipomoea nil]|uniref:defensin D2-like isoform X2 n=1 Tax=Ipomoea nil TaxID=35883 RepID=UPI0009012EA2|nr:PREDICTED: defensin D2-like isoform X2 [Ipomoea nil]